MGQSLKKCEMISLQTGLVLFSAQRLHPARLGSCYVCARLALRVNLLFKKVKAKSRIHIGAKDWFHVERNLISLFSSKGRLVQVYLDLVALLFLSIKVVFVINLRNILDFGLFLFNREPIPSPFLSSFGLYLRKNGRIVLARTL